MRHKLIVDCTYNPRTNELAVITTRNLRVRPEDLMRFQRGIEEVCAVYYEKWKEDH